MNILLIVSLILFLLAAIPFPTRGIGLGWLACFFYVLSMLIK